MPLYEYKKNAENRISIDPVLRDQIISGPTPVCKRLCEAIAKRATDGRPVRVALDGWYGIAWPKLIAEIQAQAAETGLKLKAQSIVSVFRSPDEIANYRRKFTVTSDPGFGAVNDEGRLIDLIDTAKLNSLRRELTEAPSSEHQIVYGPGAALAELDNCYDLKVYFDKTRQPILWELWEGKLVPFGRDDPQPDYRWKDYYYCDYHLLDRQKECLIECMDFWVEGNAFDTLKLVPRATYDEIVKTLVQYPVKEVPIFQPGPWGAYRYRDLFDVPGLECNAWNQIVGPELSMVIDLGSEVVLNMPTMNLMQYAAQFVGQYIHETYPRLFPVDAWLDDGFFPESQPDERISMPIHIHPDSTYVKRHFKEPLGRYETYYIVEAYEGAGTWLGFKDDADIEEWEKLCRQSDNQTPIADWQRFLCRWDSNVGDLYLIPGGTTHGHGGNQMVLEMDTCPSIAGTEYSFFQYDFARPSWNDETKDMSGNPLKMHHDHASQANKWVRESWAREHLLAKPKVEVWTKDYVRERFSSDPRMPFEIERFQFATCADNDTNGRFFHVVTLTAGSGVSIRSKTDPSRTNFIQKYQSAIVPACFGEYEFVSTDGAPCTVVQQRWKKG
jgi:mannose-6-phosphate isomerase class I